MDDYFSVDDFTSTTSDDNSDFLLPKSRRRRLHHQPSSPPALSLLHDRLFLVPLPWWRASHPLPTGVLFTAVPSEEDGGCTSSRITDIVLHLNHDDVEEGGREGVSGRDYALVSESMWFQSLKWHSDNWCRNKEDDDDVGCSTSFSKYSYYDNRQHVFPLNIRLSPLLLMKSLLVKISPMDNTLQLFERACQIFDVESDAVRILDFSGQMNQFFEGGGAVLPNGSLGQVAEEALLELQVYGLPAIQETFKNQGHFGGSSMKMNGTAESDSSSSFDHIQSCNKRYGETGLLGLTGLVNLGNTCFMNSAIQCLSHTPELVDYFLADYKKEINLENPLGMNGELALAFGDLLRKLWTPGGVPVAPRLFKSTLENFAPQFSGYNQHDSQELLAFLLDGLHEDLNRVKQKPYIEVRDPEGRPNDEVANEYWQNHLARNDSIIVDMCQGQYRSTVVCPICKKLSVTFDPFMYLSLPLPSTTTRSMTVTLLSAYGSISPSSLTVAVPKDGRLEDLIQALSIACSLKDDEALLVAEVFNHRILHFLEDPSHSLELIRDGDLLVAYRLPKGSDSCQLVVFTHQQSERKVSYGKARSCWSLFGIPLVTRISDLSSGSQIHDEYLKCLSPFKRTGEDNDSENSKNELAKMMASMSSSDDSLCSDDEVDSDWHVDSDFNFTFTDDRSNMRGRRIKVSKPLNVSGVTEKLNVLVSWSQQMVTRYDTCYLSLLPEVFKPEYPASKPEESVSLYKCLEGFSKEEPLGPEDMWYCPTCKEHCQASKKLDLWRLPEILVVHLKRFSYSRFLKNKLETYVDFPVDKLDLSGFLAHENGPSLNSYRLYAISNHYGGLGGGHYTALVHHGNRWYEFNDSMVEPIREEEGVKTSAAYVLFYRRLRDT